MGLKSTSKCNENEFSGFHGSVWSQGLLLDCDIPHPEEGGSMDL
jgi:hypothetical protein